MIKKNRSAQIFEYEWPKMTFDWGVQAKVDVALYIIQLYIKMYYIKSTFMRLADAFIQRDLQCIQVIHVLSVCVFPGNRTHNLCAVNTMLYHWATGTQYK